MSRCPLSTQKPWSKFGLSYANVFGSVYSSSHLLLVVSRMLAIGWKFEQGWSLMATPDSQLAVSDIEATSQSYAI